MTDRAVVDDGAIRTLLRMAYESGCDKCGGEMVLWNDIGDMRCQACGRTGDAFESDLRKAQPRALVALSEDLQWLVVLTADPVRVGISVEHWWNVHEWNPVTEQHEARESVRDTGQDAHEVLAKFLEGRDE